MKTTSSIQSRLPTVVALVLIWIVYSVGTLVLQNTPVTKTYAGLFITISEFLLNIVIAIYAFWIRKHTQDKVRIIFTLFAFSFLCGSISNILYNLDMYVLQVHYLTSSFLAGFLYNGPYVLALLLDFLAWAIILRNIKNPQIQIKSKIFNYIPVYLMLTTILLVSLWQYAYIKNNVLFAPNLAYTYIQFIFYVANIILILLCSALTQNNSIFLMACGYIIFLGTSIGIDFGVTATPFDTKNIIEFGWVLGTIFILYGMHDYKTSISQPRLKSETSTDNTL